MKLTRCDRGHYYDMEKFAKCPECGLKDDANTVPRTEPNGHDNRDDQKTIYHGVGPKGKEPVVGWLVCVKGTQKGMDFRIKPNRNSVGRNPDYDIHLTDNSVSRDVQLVVVYDAKACKYMVTPGDSKSLAYLNDEVVLEPRELKAHDIMTLGDTELMFVPLCGEKFTW